VYRQVTRFYVPNRTDERGNFDGPLILHYINPSLNALKAKYRHIDPANGGGPSKVDQTSTSHSVFFLN
jgi:hypothetical protein